MLGPIREVSIETATEMALLDADRRRILPWRPTGPELLQIGDDEPPERTTDPSSGDSPAPRTASMRVVIVEDEVIIAFELEDILKNLGAEVVGMAMSADEALRLVDAQRPDCVTMDISLKGDRDGISAALEIYARFGIRSLFVSAYGDAGARARAEPARPLGWIAKPIREDELDEFLGEFRDRSD